jgi:riboflavin kinase / FMN adenylyltransferase
VHGIANDAILGVANVGNRPTRGGHRSLLEVHLFDFDQSIYGHYLQVDFIHKLRDEKRFDSFELLKTQIQKDVDHAKQFFRK